MVGDLADVDVPERLVARRLAPSAGWTSSSTTPGSPSKPAFELTAEDFDSIFSVDVRGAFLCAQSAAHAMGEEGGVIVNITSVHEHVPRPGFALYAPAKAALGMLTRSLALELAPAVRVVSVAPGVIGVERNKEDADKLDRRSRLAAQGDRRRWRPASRGSRPTRRATSPARAISSTAASSSRSSARPSRVREPGTGSRATCG